LTDLTLNSGATINFSHEDGEPWQTLTINEDYVGNGGKLVFNTATILNANKTIGHIETIIAEWQNMLGFSFNNNLIISLYVHFSCM
ncbi:hypothetical protein MJM45_29340, partial [Salmonella enterica subsp. enterica serovar Kentucky]|nr:hypothetical protein [Salmonella enterica subsp. enterica serovar Kentucky]